MMLINLPKLLVESSFCMLVFYAFYFLMLRKETFFQVNRFYLLLCPALSILIPMLDISLPTGKADQAMEVVYPALFAGEEIERILWSAPQFTAHSNALTLGEVLFYIYLIGAVILAGRLLVNLWQLWQLIFRSKRQHFPQAILVEVRDQFPISSFFNYIFWKGGKKGAQERLIWQHELVHIRQRHSIDLLIMELMVISNWFNPLIYCFKNSLILTHEYIADQEVVKRSKAKLDYAKLLVKQTTLQKQSRLLHTFNSLTKMRLIMLGKTNSKPWRGVKYFLSLPMVLGLSLLFSFNQLESLPDQVSQPLTEAENYLQNLKEQPLKIRTEALSKYQIQWGDKSCDCYNDQFPTFYHCGQITIPLKEFKRLAKKSDGFSLLENSLPITYQELEVMSKRMLPLDGYDGQFDYQNTFNNQSIFWDKIEKGDVLKFTFKASEKYLFSFDITINTRQNKFDYAYHFCFEEEAFPVDMTNDQSIRTVDMLDFAKVINQPLTIKKNKAENLAIKSFTLRNQKAMRIHQVDSPNSAIILADYPAVTEAQPGDRVSLDATTIDGKRLRLAFDIRKNSSWTGERRKLELVWDGKVYDAIKQPIYIDIETIKARAEQPMSFRLNGTELAIKSIGFAGNRSNTSILNQETESCQIDQYQQSFACLEKMFSNGEKDDSFFLNDIQTDSDHKIYLYITSKKVDRVYTILRDTVPTKNKPDKVKQKQKEKIEKESQKQGTKQETKAEKELKEKNKVKEQKQKLKIKQKEESPTLSKPIPELIQNETNSGFDINQVLFILDGKNVSKPLVDAIDPNSIEKIEVLKGESAVSKYGEKAKEGVVIITSKENKVKEE